MYSSKPSHGGFKIILRKRKFSENGFSLIVTLSLLVLLAILAVGLLSLSSIALRSSLQGRAQSDARANSRMALMLALGELQFELGPDRRVNGPASLNVAAQPGAGQWLAVYEAWRADEAERPQAATRFRRYLVSGPKDTLTNLDSAKAPLSGDTMEILGKGTLGDASPSDRVNVGVVKVANPLGRYAWWISDENSKAKVNAGRDTPATVTPELMAMQAADSAPGSGFRLVSALDEVQVTGRQPWEMGDDLRSKCVSLSSANLLPGALSPLGGHFHDLSTSSYGLLVDVRNGRLQRDLSLYLEQPHSPRLRQPLYTVGSSSVVNFAPDSDSAANLNNTTGITMEELWLYYNLYKEIDYDRPASNDDRVGRRPAGFPTLLSGNSRSAVIVDKFYPYKRRVYSQMKYMLSLAAVPSATEAGKFDLRIAIDPVVVLWNPYNVALEYQTGGFESANFSGLPYIAEFTTPGGIVTIPFTKFFNNSKVNLIQGQVGRDHPIVLQPGESRVFSRVDGRGDILSSGWRYTEGTLLNHASFPKALSRNDTVRLTLKPTAGGYINYLTYWFGLRTLNPALQSGTVIMRGDTTVAELPTITTPQTITVGNVVDDIKIPHMLLSQHMRTETDNRTPSKPWIWSNPSVIFRQAADSGLVARLSHQMELQVTQVSSWENPQVQITPGNQAYWGGGVQADFGVPFFTLRGVPLVPIKSIASFQNSCANGFRRYWKDSPVSTGGLGTFPQTAESLDGHRYLAPMGSKLIGNSFSHPLIPAEKTHHTVMVADDQKDPPVAESLPLADHSYLANAALWDSWYFSSLSEQNVHPFRSNTRSLQEVFDDFFPEAGDEKPVPLPSVRMIPHRSGDQATLRSLVTGGSPSEDAYRRLAAHLMVDGAFNVNSTSVTAWKVMLGSLRGHPNARLGNESAGVSAGAMDSGDTPVTGLLAVNGGLSSPTANTTDPDQWVGFRSLNDSEIEKLATELVSEIKQRGPFLSLSDFVNRRPDSSSDFARQGTLQAAIDAAGLNGALDKGARALGPGEGSRAAGIPGYISQADLLTPLGPVLRARSDTFTIRAYGSANDKEGKVLAEAWCEAVVQRTPEYIDEADAPDMPDTMLTSQVNRTFGRKFQIVGFRWLNATEI